MSQLQDPIFKSVGQALYIIYAAEVTTISRKGATQVAIENMMEDRYGDVVDNERERQIDMGSMTPVELRAQCAVMRGWVDKILEDQQQELNVIYARYGQRRINDYGTVTLDRRRIGCEGLSEHLWTLCQTQNKEAAYALIFGLFASGAGKRRADFSLRKIERELGPSKSALHRDQGMLKQQCQTLEIRATVRLEEQFMRKGVLPDPAHT